MSQRLWIPTVVEVDKWPVIVVVRHALFSNREGLGLARKNGTRGRWVEFMLSET